MAKKRRTKSRLRWLEYALLIAGLVAVDCYIWINVESVVYQAYESWKFDRSRNNPEPSASNRSEPRQGRHADDLIGRLEIPRLEIKAIIREGDDDATLRHAVGHISSTAAPGEVGNVALAAHRDTFFRPLRNIRKNDRIIVSTLDGTYEYLVQTTKIVSPSDVSVLKASAEKELTLVTCYPFYYVGSAPRRFVVHATQVGAIPQPRQQQIGS